MYVYTHISLDSVFVYIMHIYSRILAHIPTYTYTYIYKRFKKNRTDLTSHPILSHSACRHRNIWGHADPGGHGPSTPGQQEAAA